MSWTKTLGGIAAIGMVGAGGCGVGLNSQPSGANAPAAWIAPAADGVTEGASTPSSWWASFNDVELDSLIQRAARSNLDLRVAEARLRQARAGRAGSAAAYRSEASR